MSSQCWDYADSAISWRQFWTSSRVPLFSRQFLYTKWWGGGGGGCLKELTLYWGLSIVGHHGCRVWEKEYSRKFSLCSKLMVLVATAPLQAGKKKHNCNKEITASELGYSSGSGPQQRWTAITVVTQTSFACWRSFATIHPQQHHQVVRQFERGWLEREETKGESMKGPENKELLSF